MAWLVGAVAVLMSSMTLSIFHITPDRFSLEIDAKPDLTPAERTRQKEAFLAYTAALEAARKRVVPLAVAELLLGAGMVVFAQRATVGKPWARQALVQLTVAHVALSGLEWALTPDIRGPEDDFQMAYNNVDRREVPVGESKRIRLALLFGFSAITVFGLTLPGSRAFYAEADGVTEP